MPTTMRDHLSGPLDFAANRPESQLTQLAYYLFTEHNGASTRGNVASQGVQAARTTKIESLMATHW